MSKQTKKPTPEEIKKELAVLKELKPNIRQFTAFGEDNRAAMEAQIVVLEKNLTEDQIDKRFTADADYSISSEAHAARDWLDGCYDGEEALSKDWEVLRIKKPK